MAEFKKKTPPEETVVVDEPAPVKKSASRLGNILAKAGVPADQLAGIETALANEEHMGIILSRNNGRSYQLISGLVKGITGVDTVQLVIDIRKEMAK